MNKLDYLKKLPMFSKLDDTRVAELAERMETQDFGTGQVLFRAGDASNVLYIIKTGRVNIVLEEVHDQPLVINHLSPGDFFGEMALLGGERRSAAAITATPTEMYVLKSDDILLALRTDPELAIEIIRGIASKLRFATLYIQKAISWSQHIASGQYHSAMGAVEYERAGQPKETQVDSLIANFFRMIQEVTRREEKLHGQLTALRIEIDEVKRKDHVAQITETDYFCELQNKARILRCKLSEE
ncbi:MAG: cyclic nucleotide-binding domain-containing protein [Candidatus Binatia bacterium]